jgi:hypothetical protein
LGGVNLDEEQWKISKPDLYQIIAKANTSKASTSSDRTAQLQKLTAVITNLYSKAKDGQLVLSVMFMPPQHLCSKRSTNAYNANTLKPRAAARAEPEKLLSELAPPAAVPAQASSTSVKPSKSIAITGPVATCFSSQASCERGTNNCSSHGSCIKKWAGASSGDCYGCMCTIPEVRTNPDGSKKTTTFGGAACNKKDIVMPFWLLFGTALFLGMTVIWGIGLLYSMGSEELPSVIGAGVSGPTRK